MQLSKEASQPFLDVDRAVLGCPLPQQMQYTLCLPVELNDLAMNSSQASLPAEQTDSGASGRAHDTLHSNARSYCNVGLRSNMTAYGRTTPQIHNSCQRDGA